MCDVIRSKCIICIHTHSPAHTLAAAAAAADQYANNNAYSGMQSTTQQQQPTVPQQQQPVSLMWGVRIVKCGMYSTMRGVQCSVECKVWHSSIV
jgi:hypothetical protein